jgi:hypothetical protein
MNSAFGSVPEDPPVRVCPLRTRTVSPPGEPGPRPVRVATSGLCTGPAGALGTLRLTACQSGSVRRRAVASVCALVPVPGIALMVHGGQDAEVAVGDRDSGVLSVQNTEGGRSGSEPEPKCLFRSRAFCFDRLEKKIKDIFQIALVSV